MWRPSLWAAAGLMLISSAGQTAEVPLDTMLSADASPDVRGAAAGLLAPADRRLRLTYLTICHTMTFGLVRIGADTLGAVTRRPTAPVRTRSSTATTPYMLPNIHDQLRGR